MTTRRGVTIGDTASREVAVDVKDIQYVIAKQILLLSSKSLISIGPIRRAVTGLQIEKIQSNSFDGKA
jgi:hypothetical protein